MYNCFFTSPHNPKLVSDRAKWLATGIFLATGVKIKGVEPANLFSRLIGYKSHSDLIHQTKKQEISNIDENLFSWGNHTKLENSLIENYPSLTKEQASLVIKFVTLSGCRYWDEKWSKAALSQLRQTNDWCSLLIDRSMFIEKLADLMLEIGVEREPQFDRGVRLRVYCAITTLYLQRALGVTSKITANQIWDLLEPSNFCTLRDYELQGNDNLGLKRSISGYGGLLLSLNDQLTKDYDYKDNHIKTSERLAPVFEILLGKSYYTHPLNGQIWGKGLSIHDYGVYKKGIKKTDEAYRHGYVVAYAKDKHELPSTSKILISDENLSDLCYLDLPISNEHELNFIETLDKKRSLADELVFFRIAEGYFFSSYDLLLKKVGLISSPPNIVWMKGVMIKS